MKTGSSGSKTAWPVAAVGVLLRGPLVFQSPDPRTVPVPGCLSLSLVLSVGGFADAHEFVTKDPGISHKPGDRPPDIFKMG